MLEQHAAKARDARKRGGTASHVAFDEEAVDAPERAVDVVALDDALTALAAIESRKAPACVGAAHETSNARP